jgi:hypothetical protein
MVARGSSFLFSVCLLAASMLPTRQASACEFAESSISASGPLIVLRSGDDDFELPQNLAFLLEGPAVDEIGAPFLEGEDEDGNPVSLRAEPVGGELPIGRFRRGQLHVLTEPVPAGTLASGMVIGDYVDDQAPTAPKILSGAIEFNDDGCGTSSCGEYTELRVAIEPASDDHVPPLALVYAVYLASSKAKAATAPVPEILLQVSEFGDPALWTLLDDKWSDSDAWLSISTLDAAGNESPRTEPIRVNTESGACALGTRRRGGGFQLAAFVLAACAAVIRRVTKRRAK